MKNANDAQIKVYLYLLRIMSAHGSTSISDLADQFNHTEKDVVRSLHYWEKRGLLDLRFGNENELLSICLRKPSLERSGNVESRQPDAPSRSHILSFPEQGHSDPDPAAPAQNLSNPGTASPEQNHSDPGTGSPEQNRSDPDTGASDSGRADDRKGDHPDMDNQQVLDSFRSGSGHDRLLFVIEQYLGKPLSMNEIRTVHSISGDLHFSDELIDYLFQYCVDRGKKDIRYIRKVAENWSRNGVTTPSQAEACALPGDLPGERPSGKAGPSRAPSNGTSGSGPARAEAPAAKRRSRASNTFNQFEQNSYDFDALENELLNASS